LSRESRREKLRELMERLDLGAPLMRRPANFAWYGSMPKRSAIQSPFETTCRAHSIISGLGRGVRALSFSVRRRRFIRDRVG
jgi:hypothetical protein